MPKLGEILGGLAAARLQGLVQARNQQDEVRRQALGDALRIAAFQEQQKSGELYRQLQGAREAREVARFEAQPPLTRPQQLEWDIEVEAGKGLARQTRAWEGVPGGVPTPGVAGPAVPTPPIFTEGAAPLTLGGPGPGIAPTGPMYQPGAGLAAPQPPMFGAPMAAPPQAAPPVTAAAPTLPSFTPYAPGGYQFGVTWTPEGFMMPGPIPSVQQQQLDRQAIQRGDISIEGLKVDLQTAQETLKEFLETQAGRLEAAAWKNFISVQDAELKAAENDFKANNPYAAEERMLTVLTNLAELDRKAAEAGLATTEAFRKTQWLAEHPGELYLPPEPQAPSLYGFTPEMRALEAARIQKDVYGTQMYGYVAALQAYTAAQELAQQKKEGYTLSKTARDSAYRRTQIVLNDFDEDMRAGIPGHVSVLVQNLDEADPTREGRQTNWDVHEAQWDRVLKTMQTQYPDYIDYPAPAGATTPPAGGKPPFPEGGPAPPPRQPQGNRPPGF